MNHLLADDSHELCGHLKTHQPLGVILCHLSEKGRREIVEEVREGQVRLRKMNESEETEEI